MLAVWRWRWPASFARFIARPARGKWRRWHYRRHWAAVMTIGRLAPVYQGRLLLPVLGKVTSTGYTDRRRRCGWSPASPRPTSPPGPRTWPTGSARCCAGSAPAAPASLVLELVRRDALAAIIPALPIPAHDGPAGAAGRPP